MNAVNAENKAAAVIALNGEAQAARERVAADRALLSGLYALMLRSREIDRVCAAVDGHWHAAEGEEAVIAACYAGWRAGDWIAPHYRGMVAAAVARGADLRRLFAGVLGKATSYSGGRYRSDVCAPIEFKLIGLYSGALGPTLEYAAGAALAAKVDGAGGMALAVFGDGTSSRGNFHEALNLAAVLKLPAVYVCQNNQVAISTPSASAVSASSIADRGAGYGIPGVAVDGNDVIALRAVLEAAVARARSGGGPTLVEALTYRVSGHFASDAAPYRDAGELQAWRARDPVARLRAHLVERGMLDDAADAALRESIRVQTEATMAQAKGDPDPDRSTLGADAVFAGSAA